MLQTFPSQRRGPGEDPWVKLPETATVSFLKRPILTQITFFLQNIYSTKHLKPFSNSFDKIVELFDDF